MHDATLAVCTADQTRATPPFSFPCRHNYIKFNEPNFSESDVFEAVWPNIVGGLFFLFGAVYAFDAAEKESRRGACRRSGITRPVQEA